MANPRVLIIQTGTAGALATDHGDYPAWFRRSLALPDEETPILAAHEGARFDRDALFRNGAAGIIVTGSPLSLTEPAPWMEDLGGELLRAGARGVPVLGVCFGHHLLAQAAGGKVVRNPRGRELGTVQVQLTEAGRKDPLFAWTKETLVPVQATHVDAVYAPDGAAILASNENTPVQALRFSETVASVQFHPELSTETLRALVSSRAGLLREEGCDPDQVLAGIRETSSGQLIGAFLDQVRRA